MIYVERQRLLTALNTITRIAVNRKNNLPILENVLISPLDGKLKLAGTNLESHVTVHCEADSRSVASFTVSTKKLMAICKAMPEDSNVGIALVDDKKAMVKSGNIRFSLDTLPAPDFPYPERKDAIASFLIPANVLKEMLANCSTAMGIDDARYYLNGTLLHIDGTVLTVVATNGHRLSSSATTTLECPLWDKAILPYKFAQALARELPSIEDSIRVEKGDNFCRITWGETTLQTQLIDGKFPEYQRVIPRNPSLSALIDSQVLRKSLALASILKSDKHKGIKFTFSPNKLEIESVDNDETFHDEISCEYTGDEVAIGFDAKYISDVLIALGSESVMMGFTDHTAAILLTDPEAADKVHVVMPMRL